MFWWLLLFFAFVIADLRDDIRELERKVDEFNARWNEKKR